ncbi:uncharacterized protein LOC122010464 [Zingiber officinale]|uniref:uncharacterized protein LOC122010464 n=1 Tax=Zingiber officinale TaxID=94328 RepID=UPI001C4CEECA|nr:uncharacterized protein LOC122010464 [Zingiber officinale]
MLEGILHTFGLSPVSTEIGAPFVVVILRSFAYQETPSVAVLQTLNDELTPSLPSDPAVAAGPQLSEPRTSDAEDAPTLIEPPAPSPADSALPRTSDQPAAEPSPAGPMPSLPPTMKLRLTRKGKRAAPVTATSPPHPRRQRVVITSSLTRSSDTGSTQETSLAREKASDLEVADPPSDLTAPLPIQSVLPAPPSSSGDQPPDSLARSTSPPLVPMSSAVPTLELSSADLAFEASWRLPSETDPAYVPAADLSPIFGRVDLYGDLSISWQSANRQFWESNSPLKEFDQIARSLVATCSASLSVVLLASAAAAREATLRTQWEACQTQLQSLQAELSQAQGTASQGQSDLAVARAEAAQNKGLMEEYQKLGRWMVSLLCHGAVGGVRQAFEQGYLRSAPPATFLDTARLARELPQETFPSFEADDGLFLLDAPPSAADQTPTETSAQDLPAVVPETSDARASPSAELADPVPRLSAPGEPISPSPNVV